jgi:tRNA pseudouridine38-40 synthase
MRNIKLTLAYDGTHFYGWQVQPNKRTVQGVVEKCINTMVDAKTRITGSGRTDAGVHALAQVANFRTESRIDCKSFMKGLNSLLPQDVRVTDVLEEEEDFDSRRSATSRKYRYLIFNGEGVPSPFVRNYVWSVRSYLNTGAMQDVGEILLGVHDFSSFVGRKNETDSTVREVLNFTVVRIDEDFISIEIEANAFLRHMVRNVVGTLFEVGLGKMGPNEFLGVLNARDRRAAGITAPSQGLYLVEVKYPRKDALKRKAP